MHMVTLYGIIKTTKIVGMDDAYCSSRSEILGPFLSLVDARKRMISEKDEDKKKANGLVYYVDTIEANVIKTVTCFPHQDIEKWYQIVKLEEV